MSTYKRMFDTIEPLRSPSELAAAALAEKRPARGRRIKPLAAAAAGLAAAMTMTFTVGAVNGWDIGGIVRSFFGAGSRESIADKFSDIDILDYSSTFENLSFELLGAVNDDNISSIFIEVTRTDGKAFDSSPYAARNIEKYEDSLTDDVINDYKALEPQFNIDGYLLKHVNINNGKYGVPLSFSSRFIDDGNDNDNKLTFAMCFSTNELSQFIDSGYADLELNIRGLYKRIKFICGVVDGSDGNKHISAEYRDAEIFEGSATAKLSLRLSTSPRVKAQPNMTVNLPVYDFTDDISEFGISDCEFMLTNISVTSISLSVTLESMEDEKDPFYLAWEESTMKLNMKDGSSITIEYSDGEKSLARSRYTGKKWKLSKSFLLGKVIDINDVASVEIGDIVAAL